MATPLIWAAGAPWIGPLTDPFTYAPNRPNLTVPPNQAKITLLTKSNEQKTYALSAFDRYVAEPVHEAIKKIDQLMSEIEDARHAPASGNKNFAATIQNIVENKVLHYLNCANRLCREADAYMEQQGYQSNFGSEMHFVTKDEPLDDLIVLNLDAVQGVTQPKIVLDSKARLIEKAITSQKAKVRFQLTKAASVIAASYDTQKK
jgi:hypothetical protein